jgi:hypothetical protein
MAPAICRGVQTGSGAAVAKEREIGLGYGAGSNWLHG